MRVRSASKPGPPEALELFYLPHQRSEETGPLPISVNGANHVNPPRSNVCPLVF